MNSWIAEQVINEFDERFIIENIEYFRKRNKKSHKMIKLAGMAAAMLMAVCVLSFSGLAVAASAGNMTAFHALSSMFPKVAERLIPVNESCEDNGIRMRVEGIAITEDQGRQRADIYISMQDLTGNRIDETTDLFDSYDIQLSEDGEIGHCSMVSFEKDSRTATFLITVREIDYQGKDNQRIENQGIENHGKNNRRIKKQEKKKQKGEMLRGQRVTFRVSELLSGKTDATIPLEDIHLNDMKEITDIQKGIDIRGCGGLNVETYDANDLSYLLPDENAALSPANGVTISNYGFVDGKLHIQAHYEDIHHYDNHGQVYLMDQDGGEILPMLSVAFWDADHVGSYEEYIFDILPEGGELSVWGRFVTCRTNTKGNWQVSFIVDDKMITVE